MRQKGFEVVKYAPPEPGPEDALLFEPFFRRREESNGIKKLETLAQRRKFAMAFEMVGCVRCETKERPHAGCGFCDACYGWYRSVLKRAEREAMKEQS